MTVAASLSTLYRGWVAHRDRQVADLVAQGLTDPAAIAAALDMPIEAARAYLARHAHASAAAHDTCGVQPPARESGGPEYPSGSHTGLLPSGAWGQGGLPPREAAITRVIGAGHD